MKVTVDKALIEAMTDHGPDWIESERAALNALRATLAEPAVGPSGHMYELLNAIGEPNGVFIAVFGKDSRALCKAAQIKGETSEVILPFWVSPPPPAEPAAEPVVCTNKQVMEVRNSIGLMKNEDERNNYGNHATAIKVLEAFLASPPPPAEPAVEPVAVVYSVTVGPALLGPDGTMVFESTVISNQRLNNNQKLYASPPPPAEPAMEPVTAQHRFRHPQNTTPDWSPWKECPITNRVASYVDSLGYEIEYRNLYAAPVPEPSPPPPAEVPMLTGMELFECFSKATGATLPELATRRGQVIAIGLEVEKAYRRKAGL